MPQCAAIVLVVLKQLSFDIRRFRRVPIVPPNYGLQACSVFVGPLKAKKARNIFKAVRVDRKVNVRVYYRQHVRRSLENRIDLGAESLRQSRPHPFQCDYFIASKMEESIISQLVDRFNKLGEYVRLL